MGYQVERPADFGFAIAGRGEFFLYVRVGEILLDIPNGIESTRAVTHVVFVVALLSLL